MVSRLTTPLKAGAAADRDGQRDRVAARLRLDLGDRGGEVGALLVDLADERGVGRVALGQLLHGAQRDRLDPVRATR